MHRGRLSQEGLKVIACISMLVDHIGAMLFPELAWLRIIGRLAFPIYCFLLVEGMKYTRNPKNYILRLGIGMLLAELPFDILFEKGFSWASQSVMVTLTLGAVMLLILIIVSVIDPWTYTGETGSYSGLAGYVLSHNLQWLIVYIGLLCVVGLGLLLWSYLEKAGRKIR